MVGRIVTNSENGERYVWLEGRPEVVAKDRIYKRKFCKFREVLSGETESVTSRLKPEACKSLDGLA